MLQQPLKDYRAIVTGGSSGIGACIVRAFAAAGASVIVNFHSDEESAKRIVQDIRENGGRAEPVQADVAEPADCGTLFDAAERAFGGIDVVVANAGIHATRPSLT